MAEVEGKPGYKQTKLGEIPEEWDITNLGDLASVITKGESIQWQGSDYVDEGIPFLRTENVSEHGAIDLIGCKFITPQTHQKMRRSQFQVGDIVISIASTLGRCALITEDVVPANTNQDLALVRLNNSGASREFVLKYMLGRAVQKQIAVVAQGATRLNLNLKQISEFRIALPDLPEQQKIAEILSTWDTAIEKLDALIEKKRELKKGLLQQLLTGKRRFWEFVKREGYQQTKLGIIFPKDWENKRVGQILRERVETSSDTEKYELFSLTIKNGLTPKTEQYERSFLLRDKEGNQYKLVYPNDILYNPMNLRIGSIALSGVDRQVLVSNYYNVLKPVDGMNAVYYSYLLSSKLLIHIYNRIAIGSLKEKKRVHWSILQKVEIPFPPLGEQDKIAAVLSTADREIQTLEKQRDALKTQKRGLMHKLLTGQVRVKVR